VSISRPLRHAATITFLLPIACGPAAAPSTVGNGPAPAAVLAPAELHVLEMTGTPAEDTVVTFAAGHPRTIILRHGEPDNSPFLEVVFPAEAFPEADAPDSVSVTVRPRAGVYGVEIAASVEPGPGGTIRFKYPVHFAAPVEAIARYGSQARFERALSLAYLREDGKWQLLESERPGRDNLQARLRGTGSYLVVAPK
jgi:hypothetical protein